MERLYNRLLVTQLIVDSLLELLIKKDIIDADEFKKAFEEKQKQLNAFADVMQKQEEMKDEPTINKSIFTFNDEEQGEA